ncbi:MAG TPA: hypothetical protein EYP10_08110 [Armatimonadetes bacterium]|nr:hypothetical protein [Armatimonadota bacterium]
MKCYPKNAQISEGDCPVESSRMVNFLENLQGISLHRIMNELDVARLNVKALHWDNNLAGGLTFDVDGDIRSRALRV